MSAPVSKLGVQCTEVVSRGTEGGVRATDFPPDQIPSVYAPSTVVLNSGYAVWELEVPRGVLRTLIDMTLVVDTIRTHGMLHTHPFNRDVERRYAWIIVNGKVVDEISLVKPHPHGEDYGVDSRRPFQVFQYIDRHKATQEIRIKVGESVLWDIDSVTLQPTTLRREITPGAAMIIGAFLGATLSFLLTLLIL